MTAAMRIAQNPHNNVLDIFGLAKADTSYQPTLASAPPDWTLTLTYLVATPIHLIRHRKLRRHARSNHK